MNNLPLFFENIWFIIKVRKLYFVKNNYGGTFNEKDFIRNI